MTMMPLLLALGVAAGPAYAKKKKKSGGDIRLKYSTDLVDVTVDKSSYDGEELEDAEQRITTLSLLDHGNRFEATYMLGNSMEVGGIVGMSQRRGTIGDNEAPTQRQAQVMLTGAYNMGLGSGTRLFLQPILGLDQTSVDDETESKLRYVVVGGDVGVRLKLNKKTTFDVAAEALRGAGKATVDGESDEKSKITQTQAGIRLGLSVRL